MRYNVPEGSMSRADAAMRMFIDLAIGRQLKLDLGPRIYHST